MKGINVCIFSDDVVIRIEEENSRKYEMEEKKLENLTNKALEVLQTWSKENNMVLNKNKTGFQFFSLRLTNADFELKIDNIALQKSICITYLGIVLDNELHFINHVNNIIEIIENRTSILKRLARAK